MSETPSNPADPLGPASGYGQAPGYGAGQPEQLSQSDERMWAMLGHLGGIVLGFIAPLVVMLVQGGKSAFTRRQAVEALNFQITVLIAYVVSFVLWLVIVGMLLTFVVWAGSLVLMIMAGIAANRGEDYRYPVNLRLVK